VFQDIRHSMLRLFEQENVVQRQKDGCESHKSMQIAIKFYHSGK
jgi:hypothetical protein